MTSRRCITKLPIRCARHDVGLQQRIGRRYDRGGQAELAADDVGALSDRRGLEKGDVAVAALAAEAAVARENQLLGADVRERAADARRHVLWPIDLQRPVADDA